MKFYYASWRTSELIIAGVVGGLISYFGINYMEGKTSIINFGIILAISVIFVFVFNILREYFEEP